MDKAASNSPARSRSSDGRTYRDMGMEQPLRTRKELLRHPARVEYDWKLSAAIAKHFVNAGILSSRPKSERPSVFDRLKTLIVLTIDGLEDGSGVTRDAKLVDLGMDSMSGLDLLLAMEEEFVVRFPQHLLTNETFDSRGSLEAALHSLGAK